MSHGKASRSGSSKQPSQGSHGHADQGLPGRRPSLPRGYYEYYGIRPPEEDPGAVQARRSGLHQGWSPPHGYLEYHGLIPRAPSDIAPGPVQQKSDTPRGEKQDRPTEIHEAAAQGTSGPSGTLPYLAEIQSSFGQHDVSHVKTHTDGQAAAGARAMQAEAFTTGDHVAFAGSPSLHTAAHEAAHVIQQRTGVQLQSGVGSVGDRYEQHADAVADRVVRGQSAEDLLDEHANPGGRRPARGFSGATPVQRFESAEHKLIGDEGSKGKDGKAAEYELAPGFKVTHGDVVAMSGDWFSSIDEMKALAAKAGKGKGTREEVEFVLYVKVRGTKTKSDFSKDVPDEVERRFVKLALHNESHFANPKTGQAANHDYQSKIGQREFVDDKEVGANAPTSYRDGHLKAIQKAVELGAAGGSIDDALLQEAATQHFLTDMFSSGHLRAARIDITAFWDAKVPMFFTNTVWFFSEQTARRIQHPDPKEIKEHDTAASQAGKDVSIDKRRWDRKAFEKPFAKNSSLDFVFEETRATMLAMLAEKGMTVSLGDLVSGAVHDHDSKYGVKASVGGQEETLYGDAQIIQGGTEASKGKRTKDLTIAAVKAGIADVRAAFAGGQKKKTLGNVLTELMPGGLFRPEQMVPQVLPESQQDNKALKWDFPTVVDLLKDVRMQEAIRIVANGKAEILAEIGDGLDAKFKRDGFRQGVINPLKADPLSFIRKIIDYAPNTGGGVGGHNTDDNANDYLGKAREKKEGLPSLSLAAKQKLVESLLDGAVVGQDEVDILAVLGANPAHAPQLIAGQGWLRMWRAIDGDNCRKFVRTYGPSFWKGRPYDEKKAVVKFLADGRTTDLAQETIIIILRTCTPAEVRQMDREIGGLTGLSWDLDGQWNNEFKRLKQGL
jgi:hypothetical protein